MTLDDFRNDVIKILDKNKLSDKEIDILIHNVVEVMKDKRLKHPA